MNAELPSGEAAELTLTATTRAESFEASASNSPSTAAALPQNSGSNAELLFWKYRLMLTLSVATAADICA
ncbi:MAG: hypothetical protein HDS96_01455 [Bacteroidales bacterium]|nr:hypothetical protein [Bacteroidales bacterium]